MADFDELLDGILVEEEFEEISRFNNLYPYPVVYIGNTYLSFNIASHPVIDRFKAVRYYVSTNLVAMLPCNKGAVNSFAINVRKPLAIPVQLKEKKIRPGWYKLYRYKDGVAIKRYDPIKLKGDGK